MSLFPPLVPADTLWITRCPVPTATAIGLNQRWFADVFAKRNYQVHTLQDTNDPNLRAQHFHHELKTLFREGGNVPAFWNRARNLSNKGFDHTVVVGLTWVDEVQLLLARPGANLSPEKLAGKVLGLSNAPGAVDIWRAMALRGYDTALKLTGLTLGDVVLKDLVAPEVNWNGQRRGGTWSQASEDALLSGEVDVIYAKGAPAVALKEKHGLEVVLDLNTLEDLALRINNGTPRPITVHRHFLDDKPELVALYLQVLNYASDWAKANPYRVADIVAAATNTTADAVRQGDGDKLAHSFDVSLSAERIAAFQNQADFLRRHSLISAPIDVADWIVEAPLKVALAQPLSLPSLEIA
ncbi:MULTISPECIES: ABC transporter substrate-binding protein [Asticcacaulis]|uniref:ABC transporter substrate-binding protein n=1 Tax=Asticcacaulis TaxID=76890 RepID=UPI001AE204FC|nr:MULTISPECIES: ABC transporter substrate-binding protein [Asticcacaulis]MBP2159135.1 ABC-type nitrate/sulfonate/bicarbonate transport system substrate-binding protein [Asticcacaulis solisilvae]MDR6800180.1 ABC-type nitrate/sulfonate/bicarbonate transport system substrate-binding protein [Asticcacaulis sp. BE141]